MSLRVDDIKAGYGDRSIIGSISFEVLPGQIMALFGHNGAGKSTTLKAILGLLPVAQGTIWLGQERIDRMSVNSRIARGLRLLPEGRGIFPDLTVAENLSVVAAANAAAGSANLTAADVFALFPVLLDKRNALAGAMSGGQQQMLAFGLSILGTPKCLLLEEPSVGLQPDLAEHLFEQISRICRERAIPAILIEHKISSALKIVDEVVILNSGRIVFKADRETTRRTDIWRYF